MMVMSDLFLSQSTQDHNLYAGGGNEEQEMGEWVALAKPMLEAHGHRVGVGSTRSWSDNVARGNAFMGADGHYYAFHTNAGGGRGTLVLYRTGSVEGKAMAEKVNARVAPVSPGRDVGIRGALQYGELNGPRSPSIIIEAEYHDWKLGADDIKLRGAVYARAIAEGILDHVGRSVIVTPSTPGAPKPKPSTPPPVLKHNGKNSAWWTRHLQQSLGIVIDGDFGHDTLRHVVAFQKAHRLDADGIVGKNTWKALGH
jgi:N-acetylmuramoyl-L-alanine amidase